MNESINLDGFTGLVYLMFLGRETYPGEWVEELWPRFVENKETVYQAVKRLERRGLVHVVRREEKKRGRPKYYQADPTPFINTLRQYTKNEVLIKKVMRLPSVISPLINKFPMMLDKSVALKLPWRFLIGLYLYFIVSPLFLKYLEAFIKKEEIKEEFNFLIKKIFANNSKLFNNGETFLNALLQAREIIMEKYEEVLKEWNVKTTKEAIRLVFTLIFGKLGKYLI